MPGLLNSKGRAVEAAREPKARRGRRRAKAMEKSKRDTTECDAIKPLKSE